MKKKKIFFSLALILVLMIAVTVINDAIKYKYVTDHLNEYASNETEIVSFCNELIADDKFADVGIYSAHSDNDVWYLETNDYYGNTITETEIFDSYSDELKSMNIDDDTVISVYRYDNESVNVVFKKKVPLIFVKWLEIWVYYGDIEGFPNCPTPKHQYRTVIKFCDNLYYDYESYPFGFSLFEKPFSEDDNWIVIE